MDKRSWDGRKLGARTRLALAQMTRVTSMALVTVLLLAGPAHAQFGAYPVMMNFGSNGSTTQTLTILSEHDETISVRLYLGDFEQHPHGSHEFGELGAHPMSCDGRIDLFPESVTLDPGQRAEVSVTVQEGPEPCWSAVFAERVLAGSALQVSYRIAIKVHGNPAVGIVDARMVAVTVEPADVGLEAVVVMDNTGIVNLRPQGSLDIRTPMGEVVETLDILPFSILPGHRRVIRLPLPIDLPSGSFLAIPMLDIGQDYLLGGQAEFEVTAARDS